jgi:hypothetical protein
MSTGEKYFYIAHVFFLASSAFVVLSGREGGCGLVKPLVSSWSGWLLAAFLGYYLLMAVLHPLPSVTGDHVRSLFVRVAASLVMGYVALAAVSSFRWPGTSNLKTLPLWRHRLDIAAVIAFGLTILASMAALSPRMRSDLFLIAIPQDREMYQLFGVYLTIALVVTYVILVAHRNLPSWSTIAGGVLWMTAAAGIAMASFFLCQMAGSNLAATMMALIGIGIGLYAIVESWLRGSATGRWRALCMLAVCLAAAGLFLALALNVAPMRIFGFSKVTVGDFGRGISIVEGSGAGSGVRLAASSIESRSAIFSDIGLQHLLHSPVFGDLGVEHVIVHESGYIHSLVSVQSHLGAIGSVLLLLVLIERFVALFRSRGHVVVKVAAGPIMLMAIIGTFFTWPMFWFLLGGLFAVRGEPSGRQRS